MKPRIPAHAQQPGNEASAAIAGGSHSACTVRTLLVITLVSHFRAKVKACLRKFVSMDMAPPKQGHGDLEISNNNNNYVPTSKVNFQLTRNTISYWSGLGGQTATLYTTTIKTECPIMWYK